MRQASATGDIATLIRIVTAASALTPRDFVNKTCGAWQFLYYAFMKEFRQRPVDMEDFIDGLLFLDATNYIRKQKVQEHEQKR